MHGHGAKKAVIINRRVEKISVKNIPRSLPSVAVEQKLVSKGKPNTYFTHNLLTLRIDREKVMMCGLSYSRINYRLLLVGSITRIIFIFSDTRRQVEEPTGVRIYYDNGFYFINDDAGVTRLVSNKEQGASSAHQADDWLLVRAPDR